MTPKEAEELTVAEMTSFIESRRRKQLDEWRMNANIGYSAGIIASMSFSKNRPRFNEVFNFPEKEMGKTDIDKSKNQMLVWAENANRRSRKRGEGKNER